MLKIYKDKDGNERETVEVEAAEIVGIADLKDSSPAAGSSCTRSPAATTTAGTIPAAKEREAAAQDQKSGSARRE